MLTLASMSDHEKVQAVWHQWSQLQAKDRAKVVIETLCRNVDLAPADFLGEITRVGFTANMDISKLIAVMGQPEAVAAMVKNAKDRKNGFRDRELLFQTTGLVQKGSGPTFNVSANATAKTQTAVVLDENARGLPSFEETVLKATKAVRSPAAAQAVIEAPAEEPDVRP
jgi:hypothetical protein